MRRSRADARRRVLRRSAACGRIGDRDQPSAPSTIAPGRSPRTPSWSARRRRRHDRRRRRRHRRAGPADRHRHAGDEEAEHAGRVLRPGGQRVHRGAAARGHAAVPRARRRRPATTTADCSPTSTATPTACSSTSTSSRKGYATPARRSRRTSPTPTTSSQAAGPPERRTSACGLRVRRIASAADGRDDRGAPTPALRRTPRPPRRRQARDHLLRRPRRCHAANEGVYGALRDGVATCASLMVPAPWARDAAMQLPHERRHRRAPHAQLRVRRVPLRPDHPRPVAAVGRGRVPARRRRPVGARRSGGGAARVPGPDRAGAGVGHRRHPPRPAPDRDHAAARVLRRLPRAGRSSSACRSACRRRSPPSRPASRSASWPPRRACCSPTTSTTTGAPAAATGLRRDRRRCSPASPRSTCSR